MSTPQRPDDNGTRVVVRGGQGILVGSGGFQNNNYFNSIRIDNLNPKPSISWPRRVGSIPPLADCFQERGLESHGLTEAVPVGRAVVLSGLGGTGKTQLAAAFAHRVWQDKDFNGLLVWVTASSRAAVQERYAKASVDIGRSISADADHASERLHEWLQTTTRRWLVVLDDLRDPRDLQGLWPVGPAGQVVVTTRRRDAALIHSGRRLIEVGLYTPEEAVAYLRGMIEGSGRRSPDDVLEEAAELAADLGYLPLALAQAAAFIHDRQETCRGYRLRLRDRRRRLSELFPPDAVPDDYYQSTVAATWSISIEQADDLNPRGLARPTLQLASALAPDGVPSGIFTTPAARTFMREHGDVPAVDGCSPGVDVSDCHDSLRNLDRLSLVSFDCDGGSPRAVRTHALVQRATLEQLSPDALASTVRAAADALVQLWPDVESSELDSALRDCAMSVKDRYGALLWAPDAHAVLFRTGRSFGECGLFSAAVKYWGDLSVEAVDALGRIHPDTLSARHNLAHWRGEIGDPAGAAVAYEQLLTDRRWVLGADHPDTLTTRNNLAYWRGEAGDPAGAAAAFEQLLADCLWALGADHSHTLATRNNLARWRGEAGDPVGAAAAAEQLLGDYLRVLGADHPHTLMTRNNLARWQGEAGDPAGAAVAAEQLLGDYLRVLGADHPHTLTTRGNLARWRGEAGDPAGAAAAFEQLLADRRRVLGPDHPHTLDTGHNIAHWRDKAARGGSVPTAVP